MQISLHLPESLSDDGFPGPIAFSPAHSVVFLRPRAFPPETPKFYRVDANCNLVEVFGEASTQTEDLLDRKSKLIEKYQLSQQRQGRTAKKFDELAKPKPNYSAQHNGVSRASVTADLMFKKTGSSDRPLNDYSHFDSGNKLLQRAQTGQITQPYDSLRISSRIDLSSSLSSRSTLRQIKYRPHPNRRNVIALDRKPAGRPESPLMAQLRDAALLYSPRYNGKNNCLWSAEKQ